ncbi:MAG: flagellar hook-basal body complex protein [Planctomycetota bacterium]|nr:flagellar hook-basal body complex protein [Planctomycetaceae bacterium]MDQ3332757.1 flagellar hook-basal body complex protein [Planctomycetota bacterium]
MGLASTLNTSLNGLSLNETAIDVLGNNIANAGTNGFKSGNVLFTTQLSRTLSVGSRPTGRLGGTNPRQTGLGATVSAIQKDFTQGSVSNSTSPSDLAIQGDGLFILGGTAGNVYARNGNFTLNSQNLLVNAQGLRVQGYGVTDSFELVTTGLTDLRIPLGELSVAERTQNIVMSGALMPTGERGTQGSQHLSEVLYAAPGAVAGTEADATTLLSSLYNAAGDQLFPGTPTLSFAPRVGGRTLEANTAVVGTDVTTLGDLAAFLDETIGIHSGGTVPIDGAATTQPGVTISGGQIVVVGNAGTVNDISLTTGDLTSNGVATPLLFTKANAANGESAVTDFVVYDSLGSAVKVKMSSTLESVTPATTTFRWFINSFDDSDSDTALATGTITFDSVGRVIDGGTGEFALTLDNTAAISPMVVTMDLSHISGISSEAAGSALSLRSQDGSDPGTLVNFLIEESGIINGVFDNGVIRTLGQVALARFANNQGLIEAGSGTFTEGVNSGPPFITTPGNFGAGTMRSGAIELSNTDIGKNLIDLIIASTNYRGNARVISSVQQLVDELLVLGR